MDKVELMREAAEREGGRSEGRSVAPRDAATLVLVDRSGAEPRVLLGRRHERHAFMPGRFVFPGGRVDAADGRMQAAGSLDPVSERRLLLRLRRPSRTRARAFALAAIRETCEEAGLLIGRRAQTIAAPSSAWAPFAEAKLEPDLSTLSFIFRAITPPKRPRRFDTRFFLAFRDAIAAERPDVAGPNAEFVELKWLTFAEAASVNVPNVTKAVLLEVAERLSSPTAARAPVPFFYTLAGRLKREELA
jgi:8-oxo-dGTP pyrophosphatase MutT (NUDIX family)